MQDCPRETCYAPETSCDLGELLLARCDVWRGKAAQERTADEPGDDLLLPWSGAALGLTDIAFLAGRARPMVVGVLGAENAGKTTLLGAWYLLLGRGAAGADGPRFAGSYTLAGWEAVAGAMRWSPGQPPTFPPHTASRGGRAPGMLHLAFSPAPAAAAHRRQAGLDPDGPHHPGGAGGPGRVTDYLLADAPGEWFRRWAINRDAADAAGARWLAEHADVLILAADREALAGESRGRARGGLQLLARRVAAERRGRPVALVWTKSDIGIEPAMERAVRDSVLGPMPDAAEFTVGVTSADGFLGLLAWVLAQRRPGVVLPPARPAGDHPMLHFAASTR